MKKMIKILSKVFLILGGIFISNIMDNKRVLAADMTTTFSGYYWHRKSSNYNGSGSFRYYYIDGMDSYCLDPDTHEGSPLSLGDWESSGVSNDIKERVLLIAYYGYNYPNHQTLEYRAATQALLWETIKGGDTKVTFHTKRFGEGTELDISKEKNEIERLIADHSTKPSFNGKIYSVLAGDSITLEDTNNVLSNFNVTVDNADYNINENKITIIPKSSGTLNVSLTKKTPYYESYKIFIGDIYQNQIVPGTVDPIVSSFRINSYYGKLNITKVDSETMKAQGDATLKGAKYGVYDMDEELVTTLVTDENGYATSGNILKMGKYYLKEIESSRGYKIDNTKYYFEVNGKDDVNLNVKEDIVKGRIKITKHDSETNTCKPLGEGILSGAKYQIVDINNNVVDTITINDDCTGISKELPYGKYKVKEIEAPSGYKIDNNIYDVFIDSDDLEINVTSREEIIKGKIKITKQDSETNACKPLGEGILSGAKYQIIDINNNVVDTITINDNCIGISKELPYGKYKVKEIEASKGYKIDNNIYDVFIDSDNLEINVTSKEDIIKNRISILKQYDYVDGTTQFLNAEANVTFEIYGEDGSKFASITTDKNGYASLEIPYGIWKFHQVNTTNGYEKIYDFYITVDENSEKEQYYNILNNALSAYLQILKLDTETGNKIELSDTTFKILNLDTNQYVSQYVGGKVISEFKTDKNGIVITPLKLSSGNYKIIEIRSPKGYLINKEGLTFTIGSDTHFNYTTYGSFVTVEYKNSPIKGQIEIIKKGESFVIDKGTYTYKDVLLDGIIYNIYAAEDIKSPDGKYIYYSKNGLVDTITTDKNGYGISKKLPLGKYYLIEVKTKDNYVLDSNKYYFELTEKNNTTPIVFELFEGFNYLKKGKVEITKKDLITGDVIANTILEIYNDKDELIYTGTTNEEGKIIIDDLKVGKYYILEKKASTGYIITTEKVYFEIKDNGEIVKAEMQNKPIIGGLEITKVDISTGEVLPDTLIEVYNDKDELIFSGRTDENGKILIENLRYGKYYFVEKLAPEGYQINNEKIWFEIFEDGKIVKSIMKNDKIKSKVIIHKVDEVDNSLEGVKIGIYDINDNLVYEGTTDKDGNLECALEYGKYYYKEISTLDGYIIDENKVYFEVLENDKIIDFKLINNHEQIDVPNTLKNNNLFIELLPSILVFIGIGIIVYATKKSEK